MDVKKAIGSRVSVRKYKDKEIPEDLINELMESARLAPSGHNAQPSRYMIIKDAETKKKLKENEIFPQDFVYTAPLLIVCCTDPYAYNKSSDLDDPDDSRALRDLAIASAFIVLRATELGLATCYIGWAEKEKLKKLLNIPEKYHLPYVIAIGYSDEEPKHSPRKTVDEIVIKP